MNEPSFSRRESVEGGAISSYDDDAHSLSLKPIQNHFNEGKISPHLSEKGNSKSDDVKNGEERSKKEQKEKQNN